MGGIGQGFGQPGRGLGMPGPAHRIVVERRAAGERGALQRVFGHRVRQVGGGERGRGNGGAEGFQGGAAARYGGVLAAVEHGQPLKGAADQFVDLHDLRGELRKQFAARLGLQLGEAGVQGAEVGAEPYMSAGWVTA
ncbi:hypothetical protein ACH47Z_29235 [Streptomyces sp. NPDC020192]|uniref:hypothetical protein n=1 Tax=Streptomyces sp. NPDC020192 TaxID=3365066 RepID=UPI00379F070A